MPRKSHIFGGVAGLILLTTPAFSQEREIIVTGKIPPSGDLLQKTVYIGDLDLKTRAAEREMDRRVSQAIKQMCAIPSPLGYYEKKMNRPCRDEAWASARPQMERAVKRARGVR